MKLNPLKPVSVLALFLFFAYGSGEKPTPQEVCEDTTDAFFISHKFVEKRLRSPSTAEFPYTSDAGVSITYLGDCTHQIHSYVDAQNGFGATVRTFYSAKVRYMKSSDMWRLIELEM